MTLQYSIVIFISDENGSCNRVRDGYPYGAETCKARLRERSEYSPTPARRSSQDDTVPGERPKQAFLHHKKSDPFQDRFHTNGRHIFLANYYSVSP